MKIAMFAPTARHCGIADYTRQLEAALPGSVEVSTVPAEGNSSLRACRERARLLNRADVAHVQYEHAFFLADDAPARNFDAFLSELHVPCVVTLHSLPLDDERWLDALRRSRVWVFAHSSRHRAMLDGIAASIDTGFLPAPERAAAEPSSASFRARFGLVGRRVLTIFGFTKPHKGSATALAALEGLPREYLLLLAGGPQEERDHRHLDDLAREAARRGVADRLRVTGYLPHADVGPALAASDFVLAPFERMSASASIAQALAWERPVVASDLPQMRELEAEFGCVSTCRGADPAALAARIRDLEENPAGRERLVRGASAYRSACTYESLAVRTVSLYDRMLGS